MPMKRIISFLEDVFEEAEEIMEYMGKAMVSNQVSKFSKGLGLDDDEEEKSGYEYDPKKEQQEEEKRAQEKAKREEAMAKRKAERAAKRNEIREKYGLKESKTDKELVQRGKTQPTAAEEKKNSLTRQEDLGNKYNAASKDKEKCSIM